MVRANEELSYVEAGLVYLGKQKHSLKQIQTELEQAKVRSNFVCTLVNLQCLTIMGVHFHVSLLEHTMFQCVPCARPLKIWRSRRRKYDMSIACTLCRMCYSHMNG